MSVPPGWHSMLHSVCDAMELCNFSDRVQCCFGCIISVVQLEWGGPINTWLRRADHRNLTLAIEPGLVQSRSQCNQAFHLAYFMLTELLKDISRRHTQGGWGVGGKWRDKMSASSCCHIHVYREFSRRCEDSTRENFDYTWFCLPFHLFLRL